MNTAEALINNEEYKEKNFVELKLSVENKTEKESSIKNEIQEDDFTKKLNKKVNVEIAEAAKNFILFSKYKDDENKLYIRIKSEIEDLLSFSIGNNRSIKINNFIISKFNDYMIVSYQGTSQIVKNENDFINVLNKLNMNSTIEEVQNKLKISFTVKSDLSDVKPKYNYNITLSEINIKNKIKVDIALEPLINDLLKKIMLMSYFELNKINLKNGI